PEWIAGSAADYISRAATLAADPAALAATRAGLRADLAASPLLDGAGFTRTLEQAFRTMWQDWCRHA
ncbi:hypothetical protein ABTM76_19940, partial [Acinetobacter baumannii]